MRHNKKFNHLGRTSAHRKAMLSNMASSLIKHKRISTTLAKAKALKVYVEPLLTRAKEDTTNSRRLVFSHLQNKEVVTELFRDVAVKIANRPGGYTRILRTGFRLGDNAEMCIIELVDYNENMGLGFATDVWGDVPASEAGYAVSNGNVTPKFETQEAVYTYIQGLLSEAKEEFSKKEADNLLLPSTDDYFFNGDIQKWSNIVVWLQARYANHLSKKDPSGSAAKVLSLLGTSVSSISDIGNLNAKYGNSTNELNQWYAFENSRADYIKMGKNLIDML